MKKKAKKSEIENLTKQFPAKSGFPSCILQGIFHFLSAVFIEKETFLHSHFLFQRSDHFGHSRKEGLDLLFGRFTRERNTYRAVDQLGIDTHRL